MARPTHEPAAQSQREACSLGFGSGDIIGHHHVDLSRIREPDCAWTASIVPGFVNDHTNGWPCLETAAATAEQIDFLVSEWPRQSSTLFDALSSWPEDFVAGARNALVETVHPAQIPKWARVAGLAGDLDLARALAEKALPGVPERATLLRADLAAISNDPRAAIPKLT